MSKLKFLMCLIMVFSLVSASYGHSGRTDSNGGHWDRSTGTYHYHNSGNGGSSSRSFRWNKSTAIVTITVFVSIAIFYYAHSKNKAKSTRKSRAFSLPKTPAIENTITGEWWDPKRKSSLKIYKNSGNFFMRDALGTQKVETCSPPKSYMSFSEWTTFTIADRIGKPDNKYAINLKSKKLFYYMNCEFGSCSLNRVMEKIK